MKIKELLQKLQTLMGSGEQADREQLRAVLKALKKKQVKLEKQLQQAPDEQSRQRIRQKYEVVHLQRKKGVEVYRAMKREQEQ